MNARFSDPAVLAHISALQQIVARMAANSANCKAWSITLVSAILVVAVDKAAPQIAAVALAPAFLFFLLDAYYLAIEKIFRGSHSAYIAKIREDREQPTDMFDLNPVGDNWAAFASATLSFSVWPFYFTLTLAIFAIGAYSR